MILGLINRILSLVEVFLRLKVKTHYYDFSDKSRKRRKQIIGQIEELRSYGDSDSADAADLLRVELKEEQDEFERVSSLYSRACGGNHDTD